MFTAEASNAYDTRIAAFDPLAADGPMTHLPEANASGDVAAALARGRHCLVLTQWIAHLQKLADALRAMGYDPVVLRGGMNVRTAPLP